MKCTPQQTSMNLVTKKETHLRELSLSSSFCSSSSELALSGGLCDVKSNVCSVSKDKERHEELVVVVVAAVVAVVVVL